MILLIAEREGRKYMSVSQKNSILELYFAHNWLKQAHLCEQNKTQYITRVKILHPETAVRVTAKRPENTEARCP